MVVALYGNNIDQTNADSIKHLFNTLQMHNVQVMVFAPFYEFVCNFIGYKPTIHSTYKYPREVKGSADLMLSIGGDGTFLDSVSIIQDSGIPVAGINFGRLGFLARIPIEKMESAVEQLINSDFTIENRTALKVHLNGSPLSEFPFALNDLTLQKRGTSMININAFIDGEYISNYWADGIIISTPTGSTAYSLSVGGPIISPNSGTFVISPIAPHNLTVRPLVIPDNAKLVLEVNARGNQILFSLDSRSVVVPAPTSITVEKAPFDVRLVCLKGETYYTTLRNKLMWGMDSRNIKT
jgi:NAD+ kinase